MTAPPCPSALIRDFLRLEAAGGLVLIAAAALAILFASTGLEPFYEGFKELPIVVTVGGFGLAKPLLHWVNDGLMALFFFLVGLEIKREVLRGELSSLRKALLPAVAAAAGMAVPALIYIAIANGNGEAMQGWAIPAATDIAFALGIMSLLGPRVPSLAQGADGGAGGDRRSGRHRHHRDLLHLRSVLAVAGHRRRRPCSCCSCSIAPASSASRPMCWSGCLLDRGVKSGVHATLAGVVTAMAIPIDGKAGEGEHGHGPLEHLEHILHPWIAFAVLPLFGFLNAGMSLAHLDPAAFAAPVTLGIAAGLFFGKQLGVFGAIWLAVKTGIASRPGRRELAADLRSVAFSPASVSR